jgi:hypothetical protein
MGGPAGRRAGGPIGGGLGGGIDRTGRRAGGPHLPAGLERFDGRYGFLHPLDGGRVPGSFGHHVVDQAADADFQRIAVVNGQRILIARRQGYLDGACGQEDPVQPEGHVVSGHGDQGVMMPEGL